jgi:peroxiredoxin
MRYAGRAVFGFSNAAIWALLYRLTKQQGELLLRLDALAEQPREGPTTGGPTTAGAHRPQGLGVTMPVPSFSLPDLSGQERALEEFRGRRLLLVNWDPGCGFCVQIAEELSALEAGLAKRKTTLALISNGDASSNRRLLDSSSLNCLLLQQKPSGPLEIFRGLGTPVAYLVDEKGRVAKPLAVGADEVVALAESVASSRARLGTERPLASSKLERNGIGADTKAPPFVLPTVQAGDISLDDYRGQRLLLVFSDPHCGPCDAVTPKLVELYSDRPTGSAEVLMVSRGTKEDNQRKVEEHGIRFLVAIQPGWQVSRKYGIFSTPSAFLLDEGHVVARDVAAGRDQVIALATSALRAGESMNERRTHARA